MANIKLSEKFPIYDITRKGILVGDVQANITACFEITFPIVFTLGDDEYTTMIEDFRKFIELLGDNILLHIQTFYHREYFSLINTDSNAYKNDTENFIERAYQMHFNERPYLKSKSYIYISQLPNMDTGIGSSLISKEFLNLSDSNQEYHFHLWVEGDAPDEYHREDKRKILFDVEAEKTSFGEALFS